MRGALREPPPGWRGAGAGRPDARAARRARSPARGAVLIGRGQAAPAHSIPPSFPREFGLAIEQVWRLHQRTVRLEVLNEVTRLGAGAPRPAADLPGRWPPRSGGSCASTCSRSACRPRARRAGAGGRRRRAADRSRELRWPIQATLHRRGVATAASGGSTTSRTLGAAGQPRAARAPRAPLGDRRAAALARPGDRGARGGPPRARARSPTPTWRRSSRWRGRWPPRSSSARLDAETARRARGAGRAERDGPAHHLAARPARRAGGDQPVGHRADRQHGLRHRSARRGPHARSSTWPPTASAPRRGASCRCRSGEGIIGRVAASGQCHPRRRRARRPALGEARRRRATRASALSCACRSGSAAESSA